MKSKIKNRLKNNRGQAAIFILMMFSLIFMFFGMAINIGMLVHHKINLQNSADMAALAGAAEQARILNMIGWKNYELRKNFKEFMYHYWIEVNDRHYYFPDPRPDSPEHMRRKIRNLQNPGRWTVNPIRGVNAVPSFCLGDRFQPDPTANRYCERIDFPPDIAVHPPAVTLGLAVVGSMSAMLALALERLRAQNQNRTIADWNLYTQMNQTAAQLAAYEFGERADDIYDTYLNPNPALKGTLTSNMNGEFWDSVPTSWSSFINEYFQNSPDSLHHVSYPFLELPQDFHDLALKTAYKNLNASQQKSFQFKPLIPASQKYVNLKKIDPSFSIFYTHFDPQNHLIAYVPIAVSNFIVGIEKDPQVPTFYALQLESQPDLPFLPGAMPWKLTAVSAASPFGSRIGPKKNPDDYLRSVNIPGLGPIDIPHLYIAEDQSIDDTQVLHDLKKEGNNYENKEGSPRPQHFREPLLSPNQWEKIRYIFPDESTTKSNIHWTDRPISVFGDFTSKYGVQTVEDLYTSWGKRTGYSVKLIPVQSIAPLLDSTVQTQLEGIVH